MNSKIFFLKSIRKIYKIITIAKERFNINVLKKIDNYESQLYENNVELFDQEANDYVKNLLLSGEPCVIAKFGTIELSALVLYKSIQQKKYTLSEYFEYIKGQRPTLGWLEGIDALCNNAGFFPNDLTLLQQFFEINNNAIKQIDVLGSYIYAEKFFKEELNNAKKINIDGYYAPFYYKNPWTIALKGKKVLVVHPFDESIRSQYSKRKFIWEDENLLPEFELITLKSVQTISSQTSEYKTWFEALEAMKTQMSKINFDVAIIGCGAYGMPLAAHAKQIGKQAIHLAGWTQVLFGIKGKRWVEMPKVNRYMNEYWEYPLESEKPQNFNKVELGCYW